MYKKPNEWSQEMFVSFLQRVIIVNSKLYYDTETVKLTDKQYDNLCKQLLTEQSKVSIEDTDYSNAFYDFDGSTGFHLYSRLTDKQRFYVDSIVNTIRFNKR